MVAKITIPKSIEAALNYNEKKVQKEHAVCLHAENYLKDASDMNFYQKLQGFQRLNSLNDRAATKTIHMSLNFDVTEKLADDKLIDIAASYMDKIGFAGQPFLVYKHTDAGHPHIHIVSTTIREDGKRINTHNIGRNQSEKARKEIEQSFGLVKAEEHRKNTIGIKLLDIEKALYGKHETKKGIAAIVTAVFEQYRFTSLPEFNAALRQYNVVADRGREEGRIYKHKGLVYRILDNNGTKIGVPIKASLILCKPTLANLELKFNENHQPKEKLKQLTKDIVSDVLAKRPENMEVFVKDLEAQKVSVVLRSNAEGRLYGITFVDNKNKCVFNGSELGKTFGINAILNNFTGKEDDTQIKTTAARDTMSRSGNENMLSKQNDKTLEPERKQDSIYSILTDAKEQFNNTPFGLLKKKKKRKSKKQ